MEGVAGGEEGAGEVAGRAGTGAGSLEAVEDLALHAVLDLTPSQHELQHLVDGVLRVFLWGGTAGCRSIAWEAHADPAPRASPPGAL